MAKDRVVARDRVIPSRPVQDLQTFINKQIINNFNINNDTSLRELNVTTVTLEQLANIVATLIKDLRR